MRQSLLALLLLAISQLLAVDSPIRAADPPFSHRTSFQDLSKLFDDSRVSTQPASCAATACHGGPRPGVAKANASRGAEYPLWLQRDPHARAHHSLSSEQGTRILQRMKIVDGSEITNRAGLNACLSCHNNSDRPLTDAMGNLRLEGVACDQCHGPSQQWRNVHYSGQWPALESNGESSVLGFVSNQDLLTRARMCASCHIGDARRNMNHDMIAAGHPPLFYEFATYHNRLPKHWRDPRSRDNEHYESTLWLVGQVAALEAQVALIQSRASVRASASSSGDDAQTIWPEFAHLDCAGCHQPLLEDIASQHSASRARWSQWNRWGMQVILNSSSPPRTQTDAHVSIKIALRQAIDELEQQLRSPLAKRQEIEACAARLQNALSQWVALPEMQPSLHSYSTAQLVSLLANQPSRSAEDGDANLTWESLSQLYLAGVATRRQWPAPDAQAFHPYPSKPDLNNAQTRASEMSLADQLRHHLLFSPDNSSPQFQVPSSANTDALQILKRLQHMRSRECP